MNMINASAAPYFPSFGRTIGSLAVLFAVAIMLCLAMGANASDERTMTWEAMRSAATTPAERTAAEIQWNTREDLKAGKNVGLPGMY